MRLPSEPLSDCVLPGEPARADVEKAYRRGFHQGAALFLESLLEGATDAEMRLWLERVREWRRAAASWTGKKTVKPTRPPQEPPYGRRGSRGLRSWERALGGLS
jgi:hypothetical protein